jgi:NADH-dependent peroxiredoxin subunit F
VRDLVNFASEIHLISRKTEFKADAPLIEEVKNSKTVVIHAPMEVRAFLGKEQLKGIRIQSVDGAHSTDLQVDGVFLEIGLKPNSKPLQGLLELDAFGQIPANRDQSTNVPGLFAAGDITDVKEKQISIAVGQGAQAGISAYQYLRENKLTKSKNAVSETWE